MASRPSKKRRLTPPQSDDDGSSHKANKSFFKNAANWDLEQDYETRARKGNKKGKESTRLPIKLSRQDGRLQNVQAPATEPASDIDDEEWLEGDAEPEEEAEDAEPAPVVPDIPEHQQILEAKEELAKIALMVNEEPEENAGAFKALAKIGQSRIVTIQKLALATQLAVYKDVIPGYRIRPASEDPAVEKLSKEVRTLRRYEQSLVSGYHGYIKELAKYAKSDRGQTDVKRKGQSIASVAIACACNLLTAVPHFNFRGDLLKILVGKLSTRNVDEDFHKCLKAIETMIREDEEGRPAMEAVSLIYRMLKAREFYVDESVLNLFLHLRLLSEFSGKASQDRVESTGESKRPKQKKQFRTKRDRKQMKEQKVLQRDMDHADALVSHEERDRMQSETLRLVFATYFRILKARTPHLMGAVLEGLSKYAHLINQDFFGDLLEALKDLIRHSEEEAAENEQDEDEDAEFQSERDATREALLCTVTAFALLGGQDAHGARGDLHLDLSYFTRHLFQGLFALSVNPDLELGGKSLHLPDPHSTAPKPSTAKNRVNLHTTTVLLIRCLTAILLPSWNVRSVPPLRLAAFTKKLMSASLHMPEKSTQAVLALLADVGGTHGRKVAALWNTEERKGDGTYNALSENVEGSNPFTSTIWEGEILRRHYCPKVREGVKIVEKAMWEER